MYNVPGQLALIFFSPDATYCGNIAQIINIDLLMRLLKIIGRRQQKKQRMMTTLCGQIMSLHFSVRDAISLAIIKVYNT